MSLIIFWGYTKKPRPGTHYERENRDPESYKKPENRD